MPRSAAPPGPPAARRAPAADIIDARPAPVAL